MLVQRVPDGLGQMPPGPELAALLASFDVARIANEDLPVVLRARSRQRSHDEAELLRVIAEMGQRDPFAEDGTISRLPGGYEYAADELRVALFWTRRAAEATQCYADRLVFELPLVHAALAAGQIDPAKARVFERHLYNLTAEHIERICAELLPIAHERTTGQLAAMLARRIISIDPARAKDQYERAVAERGVVAYLNPDGTAILAAQGLAPDEAAAANDRIHRLAKQAKRAGHPGRLDQIKADVMIGLLDGRFHGHTVQQIIATLLATHTRPTTPAAPTTPPGAQPSDTSKPGQQQPGEHQAGPLQTSPVQAGTPQGGEQGPGEQGPGEQGAGEQGPGGLGVGEQGAVGLGAGETQPSETQPGDAEFGSGRGIGIEVSVELATLLGRNDHPATLPGLGPVVADVARRVVARQRGAEWRYTLVDDTGHFVFGGITRRRPHHSHNDTHGGIVELLIPLTLLDQLTATPAQCGDWRAVIEDIAEQYRNRDQHLRNIDAQPNRRFPTTALRRHIQQRDRTCKGPGCRRPATHTDFDHTHDHQYGGPTTSTNGGACCTHDHLLKTKGGWKLHQTEPGQFVWYTPLGQTHQTRGEPILHPTPQTNGTDPDPPPF
jgi:hypothetical protein